MAINEKLKKAMYDMIYDLDNSFPDEVLTDEYYEWFYKRYIEPIVKQRIVLED